MGDETDGGPAGEPAASKPGDQRRRRKRVGDGPNAGRAQPGASPQLGHVVHVDQHRSCGQSCGERLIARLAGRQHDAPGGEMGGLVDHAGERASRQPRQHAIEHEDGAESRERR
jgi:hypothetical protein